MREKLDQATALPEGSAEVRQVPTAAGEARDKVRRHALLVSAVIILLAGTALLAYRQWSRPKANPVVELLAELPSDASTVFYVDLSALRESAFLAALYKWAPQSSVDADYAQFVQASGFNYERDLDRLGVALSKRGADTVLFAIADGHFDRKKITAYALQNGTRASREGRESYTIPVSGSAHPVSFTFLRNDRIALTNGATIDSASSAAASGSEAAAWRERFFRLAGSPLFVVLRQEGGATFREQAPGDFQSPQLAALLDQLQWISIAGKPDADHLRVILEGEGSVQTNTRQLSDVLNGLLLLAQAGLTDPKVRQQLPVQTRAAYLNVLKSADVSQIDRGDTKSVRLMFEITPEFLELARSALPAGPANPPAKSSPGKGTIRN